ncbi:MAG: hypothetical protein ACKOFA_00665, partial [Rhodoluna sp.]
MFSWLRDTQSLWAKAIFALAGGLLLASAFPAFNFAPGAVLGVILSLLSINKMGFYKSLLLGFIAGFAFYGLVLIWLTTYLGPIPWLALCIAEALFFAISVAVISLVWRWLETLKLGRLKHLTIAICIGAVYTAREFFAGRFPYGGLPWARLGLSQVENSLAKWVWALDIAGFSWLLVTLSALLTLRFLNPLPSGSGLKLRMSSWTPVISSWVIIFALSAFVPLPK